MKVRKNVLISIILFFALGFVQFATPSAVFASGTVGTGTAGSCDEDALDTALSGGGAVVFNCGASPHTITIASTKVIANDTQIDGGGLITISGGDAVQVFDVDPGVNFTITGLTVSNGSHTGNGGGMFIDTGATVTVTSSTFKDNNVVSGYGGAIYVNDATLNVSNSSFITNDADVSLLAEPTLGGGAIQNNDGTVEILGSTFNGNTVTSPSADGGAIYNGDFDGAGVPDGNPDVMTIGNSTFYNNTLEGDTGTSGSSGGAIRSNGDLTLAHNTFANNDSGVTLGTGEESGAVTFGHGTATVVYNIFANSSSFSGTAYDCAKRSLTSEFFGGNIIETNFGCGSPSVPLMQDPNLGAFQDNGGPTYTLAPLAGSNAIGNASTCAVGITTDQRGVSRPQGGATSCDIGAIEVETTAPTVTIEKKSGQADPTNVSPIEFTVTFSEPVVGFSTGDVNLSASTVGGTLTGTVTEGPTVFNVAVTGMTTPGDVIASIDAGAATDIALNGNTASTSSDNAVAFDGTGPAVTINKAVGQADPTNESPVNFTVVFDESVTDFAASDVTIGGTANPTDKLVTGSGATYNVAVSGMTQPGTVTASVNAGAVADALGNLSSASTTSDNSVLYDSVAPTVTINKKSGQGDPTNVSPIEFTVTFSENVSGFTNADVTLSSGTAVVTGGPAEYNVAVSGMNQGALTATVPSGAAMDSAGNNNAASSSTDNSVLYDSVAPVVSSITRLNKSQTKDKSVHFLVTFSDSVIGGSTSNFTLTLGGGVSGATVDSISGTGSTRTVTVNTGTGDGTIRLDVDNSTGLADAAGNAVSNVPFTSGAEYTIDKTGPSVTIDQALTQNDPTNESTIDFTVVFSESVNNFVTGDVTLTGTAGATTATVTGTGTTYNVAVTGMTANGTVIASIASGVATDALGNNNAAATFADHTVTYDTVAPTVTIEQADGQADPTNELTIDFTVTFSETVLNFVTGDVTLSGTAGASTATVTGGGTTYNVAVTNMTQNGSVVAEILAGKATDTAGNPNLASTSTDNQVIFDSENPTVTINQAVAQADPTGFSPANFTVVFSKPVTGFETGDVTLGGTSGATTATVTETAPNDGTTYNVAVSGMTSNGTAIVSIGPDVAEDGASNGNLASSSTDNTVTFAFVKPGVPALTAPANGVIVTGLQPLLNWNDSDPGAQSYRIQVATVNTFVSTVFDETNISISEFTPPTDLTPGVRYYWRVRGVNAIGTASAWSAIRNFKTALETPTLNSPIGGAVLDIDRPTFDWQDVPGAANYTLQISTVDNFSTGLITRTAPGSVYVMPKDLVQNKVLFWRVRANTPAVSSTFSTVESFKTGNPPSVPVLSAPATNALVTNLIPLFNWRNSTLPLPGGSTTFEHYQIQVADNSDFNTPVIDKTINEITSSQYQAVEADGLVPDKKYYWRVRAVNDVDITPDELLNFSAWSTVFTFRSAMEKPVLLAPANTTTPALAVRRPTFDWQDTSGATSYQIQISQFANMSTPLVNAAVSSSEYTPAVDLPAKKALFWRVRAKGPNGPSLWSTIWTFKTGNPPSVPALLTPANNALSTIDEPVFDWSSSTLPANTQFKYYEFQVDNDDDFSSPAIHEFIELRADSRYLTQPTDVLDPNTTYYWRVRAANDVDLTPGEVLNFSAWSAVRRLRMALTPPTLVAPIGTINTQPALFDWEVVPDATGYTLQVSTSSTFTTLLLNVTLTDDSYVPTALPQNKTLYWRVRANGTNKSAWSTSNFIIDTTP